MVPNIVLAGGAPAATAAFAEFSQECNSIIERVSFLTEKIPTLSPAERKAYEREIDQLNSSEVKLAKRVRLTVLNEQPEANAMVQEMEKALVRLDQIFYFDHRQETQLPPLWKRILIFTIKLFAIVSAIILMSYFPETVPIVVGLGVGLGYIFRKDLFNGQMFFPFG